MDVQERFRILETRCSSFAVELLRELRDHPQISELVADLEKIDGPIYRTDIENAFTAIRKADVAAASDARVEHSVGELIDR